MSLARESRPAADSPERPRLSIVSTRVTAATPLPGFADPGYCEHGVTVGGKCRKCPGGRAPTPIRDPRARRTDPHTSLIAAGRIPRGTSDLHAAILTAYAIHGSMVDDRLRTVLRDAGRTESDQRIGTARHELVRRGQVRYTGRDGLSDRGNPARIWDLDRTRVPSDKVPTASAYQSDQPTGDADG